MYCLSFKEIKANAKKNGNGIADEEPNAMDAQRTPSIYPSLSGGEALLRALVFGSP